MAEKEKENDETTSLNGDDAEAWGTLEELLLACAVNRHGTISWDSIAKELQKRTKYSLAFAFSPQNCKQKYVDLKRRFHLCSAAAGDAKAEERENGDEEGNRDEELLRMVDELRRLRVEELKREVQRHDLSIVSLQLKVKGLEEEREKSLPKAEEPDRVSDLRIKQKGNAMRTAENSGEPERYSPEEFNSAEDRSFNESNSSSHNNRNCSGTASLGGEGKERESKPKQRKPGLIGEPDPVRKIKPNIERVSGNGSASQPAELGESASESKRQSGRQPLQSSDVQSSASLSKRKRRRLRGLAGDGSSGDDLEAEGVSPANKRIGDKSQPLIEFMEILRSHKHGSVFLRRLASQDTYLHQNVIRQHIDLDTVQSQLDKGVYRDCHPKFYRDLLLIFTNAVIFYRKSSGEHFAAQELRKLVIHEITRMIPKSDQTRHDPIPNPRELVVKKPRSSNTSMVVCRRQSSGSMQALSESMKNDKSNKDHKAENANGRKEEKSDLTLRSSSSKKMLATKVASKTSDQKDQKFGRSNNKKCNKDEEYFEGTTDSIRKQTSVLKKQGVVNFLRRMKQNSSKNNSDEEEVEEGGREKKGSGTGKKRGSENLRRNTNTKDDDVLVSRRNLTRRGERDAAVAKRVAEGRPPKRKAAMSSAKSGKGGRLCSRDGDEKSKKKLKR